MKKICVFAGASPGLNKDYQKIAYKLGQLIAERNFNLTYGGAKIGLMGDVASGCLEKGGVVTGVIPQFLRDIEISHESLTEIIVTKTMHKRKSLMYKNAAMFIALPGGLGTLEELMEVLTWKQLGLLKEKILIVNVDNYWNNLFKHFETIINNDFMRKNNLSNYIEIKCENQLESELKELEQTK
tara:strand:- start:492 stop:1043 length:552 start_codon:yes stop_codon:yes gene_type:complete